MASPSFLTPHPLSASRPRRHFTLAHANSTLPLVRRIVTDIVQSHERVTQQQTDLEKTSVASEQATIQKNLQSELERLQDYVDELLDIGCELKDYKQGLIDFVGRHQGRDVYLCWMLGEGGIEYWHELDAGFPGRQPISTLDETEKT